MSVAPASLKQRFRRVAPYFRDSRLGLALAFFSAIVTALTEPLLAELLKHLLDTGFNDRRFSLWMVPAAIIALFAVRSAAGFVAQYGLTWAAQRATLRLRLAMFARLLQARADLFARQSASSLTNTVVYEVQNGVQQLTHALLTLVRDSLTLLALLGYLMWLNWQLTCFIGVLFPLVTYAMRRLSARLHKVTVQQQAATDELAYVVEENALAWRNVRLHGAQAQQTERLDQRAQRVRQLAMKSTVASATMTPVTQMLAAVSLSAVIALALWQSRDGGTTVGSFVAFVGAMLMLVAPLKHLSDVMGPVTRGLAAIERGLQLAELEPVEQGGTHAPAQVRGDIAFHQVEVRYAPAGAASAQPTVGDPVNALAGVSLHVQPGQTVALVGTSGAGKTTLVNLLPRFVQPSAGEVRLDGVPLPEWDLLALRRHIAYVSQEVVLFNDSVAANVALGQVPDATRVQAALEAAHLWGHVQQMAQGMHTRIGHNGSELSGGQRQRLAIARALYQDAPILILDEATSALDSESERAVQAALERLMQGRTTLVIAHRLSTIEHADLVVAMEAGRIIEQGTPAQLLAARGLYARLHALQFKD